MKADVHAHKHSCASCSKGTFLLLVCYCFGGSVRPAGHGTCNQATAVDGWQTHLFHFGGWSCNFHALRIAMPVRRGSNSGWNQYNPLWWPHGLRYGRRRATGAQPPTLAHPESQSLMPTQYSCWPAMVPSRHRVSCYRTVIARAAPHPFAVVGFPGMIETSQVVTQLGATPSLPLPSGSSV